MAATRFYFPNIDTPSISPSFTVDWAQTGQATRVNLVRKTLLSTTSALADKAVTVPITTSQNILNRQYVSEPIPPQNFIGTVSMVLRGFENATTNNAFHAIIIKIVSNDGSVTRGTLLAINSQDIEYVATAATRIFNAIALTAVTTQPGDRIVVEVGVTVSAPTAAGSSTQRFGNSAASDFALTSALTTDLNPWIEFSQDIFGTVLNNYQFVKAGDGISVGERIR